MITRATLGVALVVAVAVGFLVGRYVFIDAEPESALTPQGSETGARIVRSLRE